ncbi:F-box protein [Rhynchospora pubera]|uniref:F-box protein n=1 Tax=Rhynchospora pubera TaxID=906938 RepID=A0AAV8G2Z7_9POAL|nr:F-box protein [Rhynchospora pubera]
MKSSTIAYPRRKHAKSYFLSTAGGFILSCQDSSSQTISLFNPLTGLEISVPNPQEFEEFSVVSNPFQKDLVVILESILDSDETFVGLIRPGDEAWVIRRLDMMLYEGLCLWSDSMCSINEYGTFTWTGDATTRSILSTVPPPPRDSRPISPRYMLETCGEILLIFTHMKFIGKLEEIDFTIYQLNKVGGTYQWVKIRDIGDRMLFLGYVHSFALRASDFSGFRGNCIYFYKDDFKSLRFLLCQHDLETGTTEVLPNFSGKWSTWMIPNLSESN